MKSNLSLLFLNSINSAIDPLTFRQEIEEHRERLLQISRYLVSQFKEDFPLLQRLGDRRAGHLITKYMALHDRPKLMSHQELSHFGWDQATTIFEELRRHYGHSHRPAVVQKLNQLEARMKNNFFDLQLAHWVHPIRQGLRLELEKMEMIADTIDTKIYRGAELGFQPQQRGAGHFFRDLGFCREAEMADQIEPFVRTLSLEITFGNIKIVAN
jgi:hypothetical protein